MANFGPYPARCVAVHDGDTITLDVDLGFGILLSGLDLDGHPRLSCRVFGVNAPELNTPAGVEARFYVRSLMPPGTRCTVLSHGWDKYGGRFDGVITLADGTDLAARLVATGHAVWVTY